MQTVDEIEHAIQQLPTDVRWSLLHRFESDLWEEWDGAIKSDAAHGQLDHLIAEARSEIKAGKVRSLDEVLRNE